MLASKGLCCAFSFVGETMKSCQRSVVPEVIGQNNKGIARFDLKLFGKIMKLDHTDQNLKLVNSHLLIFIFKSGQHFQLPPS